VLVSRWEVRQGHVLDRLRELADDSVHCVVTSPPYWTVRDYKVEPQTWGGDPRCRHEWVGAEHLARGGFAHGGEQDRNERLKWSSALCSTCGAWSGALGLEPSLDLYLANILEVFEEVRRVLRPDGTLWLNLGDAYNAFNGNRQTTSEYAGRDVEKGRPVLPGGWGLTERTLKPKDLLGLPFRVVLMLQEVGWWFRSTVIWHKPNPAPESVRDRPTNAHEYLFLLSKRRRYYYDVVAGREPFADATHRRLEQASFHSQEGGPKDGLNPNRSQRRSLENLKRKQDAAAAAGAPATQRRMTGFNARWEQSEANGSAPADRNLRSVWTIAPEPFKEAHFAVFPRRLVQPCIRVGTSERGCCPDCGAPWRRVTKPSERYARLLGKGYHGHEADAERGRHQGSGDRDAVRDLETLAWEPTCSHEEEPIPAVVLDPFCGSGTTGVVAVQEGRRFLGFELSPTFVEMAERRIANEGGLFAVQEVR
jgi:DNA modification methylase